MDLLQNPRGRCGESTSGACRVLHTTSVVVMDPGVLLALPGCRASGVQPELATGPPLALGPSEQAATLCVGPSNIRKQGICCLYAHILIFFNVALCRYSSKIII